MAQPSEQLANSSEQIVGQPADVILSPSGVKVTENVQIKGTAGTQLPNKTDQKTQL